jgi:hypothetical protein
MTNGKCRRYSLVLHILNAGPRRALHFFLRDSLRKFSHFLNLGAWRIIWSCWACSSLCCRWLQAMNNEVGGVSNIKTQKWCLAVSQRCSRFLKNKKPQQLRIFENFRGKKMQNTPLVSMTPFFLYKLSTWSSSF